MARQEGGMSATRAQLEGVMRLSRKLIAVGQVGLADELMAMFDGNVSSADAASGDPTVGRAAKSNKERQADLRARRAALRVTENVTKSNERNVTRNDDSNGDSLRVARVSESQKTLLSGVVSAESETSEKVERFEARAHERNGVTENVTSVTRNVTAEVTRSVTDGSAGPPHTLWRQIFEQWVWIAHNGKSIGSPSQFSQSFTDVARMAEQRSPQDPVAYATEVIRRYVADRRKRGKQLNPRYFAGDFATFADSGQDVVGNPVGDPLDTQYKLLTGQWKAAEAAGDKQAAAVIAKQLEAVGQRIVARAS
jgi:hypothetical protein